MDRRKFIASSALAGITGTHAFTSAYQPAFQNESQDYFEFRQYTLKDRATAGRKLDDYFSNALVPSLNRAGINHVGVFKAQHGFDSQTRFLLIPYKSLEHQMEVQSKIDLDSKIPDTEKIIQTGTPDDVPFSKFDASFLKAFSHIPSIEVPDKETFNKRIFELRIYQSQNYRAGQKKIEMFNEGGEIKIFRETGLTPVFFGETLMGSRMPNLTYMLVFKDLAHREESWDKFRNSPAWKELSGRKEYKNIVSNISSYILAPGKGSQI